MVINRRACFTVLYLRLPINFVDFQILYISKCGGPGLKIWYRLKHQRVQLPHVLFLFRALYCYDVSVNQFHSARKEKVKKKNCHNPCHMYVCMLEPAYHDDLVPQT